MDCEGIKEFFSDIDIEKTKCKELAKNNERSVKWEDCNSSEFSPSIVQNDETVVRSMYIPQHFDEDSHELLPTAFDDAMNKGLSVNRVLHITYEQICENGLKVAKEKTLESGKKRVFFAYATANVKKIRSELEELKRIFAVYDTSAALEKDNIVLFSHADICGILSHNDLNKKDQKGNEKSKNFVKRLMRSRLESIFELQYFKEESIE